MLSHKLAGLQKALGLIHIAANAHIVHGDLLNVLVGVDDEQSAQRNTCLLLYIATLSSRASSPVSSPVNHGKVQQPHCQNIGFRMAFDGRGSAPSERHILQQFPAASIYELFTAQQCLQPDLGMSN